MFAKYSKHVLDAMGLVELSDLLQVDHLREEILSNLICLMIDEGTLACQTLKLHFGRNAQI